MSKRIAFLTAAEGVEEVELTKPWEAAVQAGHTAELLSLDEGEVQLFQHLDKSRTQRIDRRVSDVSLGDYDALVLPGGAVFIERGRIRGRWRHSLVSAAGPLTNVLFALVCTAPFWLHALDGVPREFRYALAFLALLQVTAAILNLLPVPGLDGYGVVEPWLPYRIRRRVEPFAQFGLLAVFGLLWIPEVNEVFFGAVHGLLEALGVDRLGAECGRAAYQFWENWNEEYPVCATAP